MNQALRKSRAWLGVIIVFLAACSRDPATRKAGFIASGGEYAKAGKYQEAVIQYRNAIGIDPRSAEAHRQLANVYLKLKSTQHAYRELTTAVELDPTNADGQLQLATFLIAAGKYDDAGRAAEKVIALDPSSARAHSLLGEKHASLQAWPLAIQEFQKAIELDANNVQNYAGLGVAYASTGRTAEAEEVLRRATKLQSSSAAAHLNLGRFYFTQHRLAEAETELRAASRADPHATLPSIVLAKIYIEHGNLAEAERTCVELKNRAPDDPEAYGALTSFYEATGQKEKAVAELQALRAAKPRDVAVAVRLTGALIDLDRVEEAWHLNQDLLKISPGDPRALTARGRLLIGQQKYSEAKAALDQAVQSDPQSASSHYFLGVAENSLGLLELAGASFSRTLELAPGMPDAAVALADLRARQGDYESALRLAKQTLQNNPDSTLAYVVAAKCSIALGNVSEAEAQLRTVLDREPMFFPALEALVDLQVNHGKSQEAVRRISGLISQHPLDGRLHFLLGLGYFRLNDLDKAAASVQRAIAINQKTPDAYGLLAEISLARGALSQAVIWYKAAIAANPNKAENYMALAGIYERQGNWDEAKRSAERAHSIDPSSPFIANNLAYLYLEHGGDVNVALSLAQQAKQKLADSPVVSDTIGWAYYKLRIPGAAVTQLSESVRRDPDSPLYRYHLGMAYMAAGRPGEAALSLRQAVSSSRDFPFTASAKSALRELAKGAN